MPVFGFPSHTPSFRKEVNVRTPGTSSPPHWCAIHMAVAGKDRFKAKVFMARGLAHHSADLNLRTGTGASPLHLAASGGSA
eukprot:928322-Alexandrium_andersonii.AAC.1